MEDIAFFGGGGIGVAGLVGDELESGDSGGLGVFGGGACRPLDLDLVRLEIGASFLGVSGYFPGGPLGPAPLIYLRYRSGFVWQWSALG